MKIFKHFKYSGHVVRPFAYPQVFPTNCAAFLRHMVGKYGNTTSLRVTSLPYGKLRISPKKQL